ncbi:YhcB family protein [Neptuniibacter sp. QD48_11]|uniref:YhcB family protein n=1 Tax=Neptuniibacter sp. QD48_11 TaxID=3398211 RepID=UPI0039F5DA17
MENVWLISIAALVVGAVIGFLMGRSGGDAQRQAELAEKLESTQKELDSYKNEVTEHFEKTAALVNNLTNSYKDVHEHLATGAQGLCQPGSVDLAIEPSLTPKLESEAEEPSAEAEAKPATDTEQAESSSEPPRDYAPKSPEDEGTLSETFGLKEEQETKEEEQVPADAPSNVDAETAEPKAKA